MKSIPNLYYFEDINEVSLENIEGNAVLFIENIAYFVKEHQFVTQNDGSPKTHKIEFSYNEKYLIQSLHNNNNGKISCGHLGWQMLQKPIRKLLTDAKFPYAHADVTLLSSNSLIEIDFSPQDTVEEIHPLLKNFNPKTDDLLVHLRKIKESPYHDQSILFFHEAYGHKREVGLDAMIDLVLQTRMPLYKPVFKKIDYISSRFSESNLTSIKQNILNDFRLYCGMHATPSKPNVELVEDWLKDYITKTNGTNPIFTLGQHRRTKFTVFSPKETDSIKLLKDFIGPQHSLDELSKRVVSETPSQIPFTLN